MEGGTTTMPPPFMFPMSRGGYRGGRFSGRGRGRGMGGRGGGGGGGGGGDTNDMDPGNPSFDGKRMRKAIHRKTVDYNPSMIHYLENRVFQRDHRDRRSLQPDAAYSASLMPPSAMLDKPMNCVTTKFVRTSTNKFRCPIFCLAWTPEGRRLVTGASSGEFTLWNGLTFNFETILQAHDVSVRAMRWSHNDLWMVTADHAGYIKYWQSNMNNVKMYQGHKEPIRGVSFCPTDSKFASCSDDGTVRIWDFMRCHEEKILRGHGADVKCIDWHPQKSLVASGSKDNQQPVKLWDPRSGSSLATLHAHKHTVMDLRWNQNGHWLLTASRDHLLKVFDIRNLKTDMQTFKGHKKEATSLAWHPVHESLFVSGGSDGSLMFWNVGCDREVGAMEEAHEGMVWSLDWHPLGHILVSGSNDHSTKFWTRNRPGDEMRDRYNLNSLPTGVEQEILEYSNQDVQAMPSLPGMGLEHGLPDHLKPKEEEVDDTPNIPGLDWNQDSPFFKQIAADKMPVKKIPFARPIPRSFEKAWLGQDPLPPTPQENKGQAAPNNLAKPGLLGLPPNMNPAQLNMLLQGNPQNIPPAVLMNIMSQMQQQPQLMALGQQMLLKHQQDLRQQHINKASGQSGPGGPSQQQQQQQQPKPGLSAQPPPGSIPLPPGSIPMPPGQMMPPPPGQNPMMPPPGQSPMMPPPQGNAIRPQLNPAMQQQNPMMQQPSPLTQQQQDLMQQLQSGMPPPMQQQQQQQQQQQNTMPPPKQQRPALLQTPPSMRPPMMSDGQNQFRPAGPGQQQPPPPFHADGNVQQGGMPGQNQFRPPGPGQFPRPPFPGQQPPPISQPPPKENFRPMPSQSGAPPMDQDLRRAPPTSGPPSNSGGPPSGMDVDLRRPPGPARDQQPPPQFGTEGDLDLRGGRGGGGGMGGPPPGGFPPPPHPHHAEPPQPQQEERYDDSDMRSYEEGGGGGGGYEDGQYGDQYGDQYNRDYDARVPPSGGGGGGGGGIGDDVDERYMDTGGYHGGDMQGYHGNYQGGPGPYEEEQAGRKRSWQEGPGRGGGGPGPGPRGRGGDPRRGGGRGGDRDQGGGGGGGGGSGAGRSVYNGPAGPIDPRRGGVRGRGRGDRGRGERGRGGRGRGGRGGGW